MAIDDGEDGEEKELEFSYKLVRKIGWGSFGMVHVGVNGLGKEVAIKMEPAEKKSLELEAKIYQELKRVRGIPQFIFYGRAYLKSRTLNMLVIDLLGPNLSELFHLCGGKFSLKTVLMLADQLIVRFEAIHEHSYLHRDVKCENFVMGLGSNASTLFVIDFGIAKKYKSRSTHKYLIDYTSGRELCGTVRYASLNVHNGVQPDRRDDMIALGYVFMYFLRGNLPWQRIRVGAEKKRELKQVQYNRIKEIKAKTTSGELCAGFPKEFVLYLNYCYALEFGEKPDYRYLRGLFSTLFYRSGYKYDNVFDWNMFTRERPPLVR